VSRWRTSDKPSEKALEKTGEPQASENPSTEGDAARALRQGLGQKSTSPGTEEAEASPIAPPRTARANPGGETTIEDAFDPAGDPLAGRDGDDSFENAFEDEKSGGDQVSRFDYSPPFTRRRNSAKMWTIAAGIFALLATGTVVAVNYYGLPDWAPFNRPTFGIGKPDLVLDFPESRNRTETLESGEKIFQVRGTVSNTGRESVSVPSLLIVFRDERDRQVANWVVVPSKRELAPGESLNVTEAIADIPGSAKFAEIGWSPN
jgi:hypothetical protein